MSKISTLLIDLDGTLLGTRKRKLERLFIFNFVQSLRQEGISWWNAIVYLHRMKIYTRSLSHQKNGEFNWRKATVFFSQLSGVSQEKSEQLLSRTALHCFKQAGPAFYSMVEAVDFITWAKPKYKLVLATNPLWPLEAVLFRLAITKIDHGHFEFITHAENMSSCKPHVKYYEELLEKLNVKAEECFMIGNDEEKDGPARILGIEVFIVHSPADFLKLKKLLETRK